MTDHVAQTKRQVVAEEGLRREDFTEERIDEIRRTVAIPANFEILDQETREASRLSALAGVGVEQGVWVFGYGSLMWNPAFHFADRVPGTIHGWHRSFCLSAPVGRGSVDQPGLMLALDRGGSCRGFAFRIEPQKVQSETRILWRREMISGGYVPRWVSVRTSEGPMRALTLRSTATIRATSGVCRLRRQCTRSQWRKGRWAAHAIIFITPWFIWTNSASAMARCTVCSIS